VLHHIVALLVVLGESIESMDFQGDDEQGGESLQEGLSKARRKANALSDLPHMAFKGIILVSLRTVFVGLSLSRLVILNQL
jgi:hypothetical protein